MQWIWDHMVTVTLTVVIGILLALAMFGFTHAGITGINDYVFADRAVLLQLMKEEKQQGRTLNVHILVLNDKTGLWDRERTLCGEK